MTVNTPSNKILDNLNAILSKRQRERENMVTMLKGAVALIGKIRDERDKALNKNIELERSFQAASEAVRDLNTKNDRLQRDMDALIEAVSVATHQFAVEDNTLSDQLFSFENEFGISLKDNSSSKLNEDSLIDNRRSYAPRAPVAREVQKPQSSADQSVFSSERQLNDLMGELTHLLQKN